MVGAIGRYRPGDPRRIVLGRHLEPIDGAPLNDGVAVLEGRRLTLDLGNSLPTTGPGGPLVDQGRLYAVLDPGEADEQVLGQISYLCQDWYETTAGIAALELSGADARRARSRPLGVFLEGEQGPEFLAESRDGRWLRADQFVFRIGSPGTATAELWATRFGRLPPEPDKTGKPKPWPVTLASVAYNTSGEKVTGLTFPRQVDLVGGRAEVKLSGDLDGEPRHYIDGQVSGVAYGFKNKPPATGTSNMLSVLVWSPYRTPANGPSWLPDVQPIFQQYANLYPVMRPIVDLSSYASVVERLGIMRRIFSKKVKVTDASYMPATRDLSPAKRRMLHAWLDGNPPRYMHTDSKEALYLALQQAVELEHATLPPYLTALYSIMPGRNVEVAELIRSVVLEEMLHMSLACNLLISIGGNPSISHPGFVPRYPGSLPGGLRGGLTVRLRRCSIEQIRDVFLSIEEPEETIEESGGEVQEGDAVEHHAYTIGWFYDQIARALETLSRDGKISFGRTGRQVETRIGPHRVFRIGSLEDALRAIHEIKEQGEGASPLDPAEQPGREDLAHFYKFSEIVHGRRIVFEKDGFGYTGDEVPFDPDAVYPMMDDPDTQTLAPGSRARILSEQFDQSYQALLNALHATFNGHPERLQQAIGAMYSLEVQASQLMQAPSGRDDGTTAGPSFQLPFPL